MHRTLPPFRADHVGSLLRSPRLKDARTKQAAGDMANDERLRSEGEAQEAGGRVQKGFGTARRKVGNTVKNVGESIKRT